MSMLAIRVLNEYLIKNIQTPQNKTLSSQWIENLNLDLKILKISLSLHKNCHRSHISSPPPCTVAFSATYNDFVTHHLLHRCRFLRFHICTTDQIWSLMDDNSPSPSYYRLHLSLPSTGVAFSDSTTTPSISSSIYVSNLTTTNHLFDALFLCCRNQKDTQERHNSSSPPLQNTTSGDYISSPVDLHT